MFGDGVNHDSDQSISDDEDLGLSTSNKFSYSLCDSQDNKVGRIQVLSQLEILRKDVRKLDTATGGNISSGKRPLGLCVEDEIELPVFNNEDDLNCPCMETVLDSDEEMIAHRHVLNSIYPSDDDIIEEEGIAFPACVTSANGTSMPLNDCSRTELKASSNRDVQNSNMESQQVINVRFSEKQEQNPLSLQLPYSDCNKHSVTKLLESLQEKSDLTLRNSEMHYRLKGRKTKAVVNRSTFGLCDRKMDGLLDVRPSNEHEDNFPNPKSTLQQRTIADQFHEAFEAVPQKDLMSDLIFHRESCCGLFESLQQVLVMEKEKEMEYLQSYGTDGNSADGRGFMDVRILSSSLEAKLNVCCCTILGDMENRKWLNYFQMRNQIGERILTIIFCSRVCSNVELEVGNLIRLYPPWKEVNMEAKDEMIILSTYFSQI